MKKIFNFTKKKKGSPSTSDTGSVLSVGYDLKEKDLPKVHKAAAIGDVAKLKQLAKKNDLNQLDKENRTALHIACANGHTEVVQFLVESKAKLNLCDNHNRSALMKAVQSQQDRCMAALLEHEADPNLVDINGNTALHLAASIPSLSVSLQLLEHEANINAQNKEGSTPLTLAVEENHAEMSELLLKEGADVNITKQEQRSPLMIAACNGQISMVRLLLQYDADITVKDDKGWSSDDYAVMNGHHACSHLIIEHGTKRKALQSPSHLTSSKKFMLGSPAGGVEAGFSLGGPATDKDDTEDNSHTDSISRVSKSGPADDSWPSSDEDDELDLSPKKPQKVNLKKLMSASKMEKKEVIAHPDKSWSGVESESEDGAERRPPFPPSTITPQHPVAPSPASFSKLPQMTSTPLSSSHKEKVSTEDEDDNEEEEEEEEEEEDDNDDDEKAEEDDFGRTKPEGESDAPLAADSKNNPRDFLSELGLEKGDDEEDSPWDSESGSDSPRKQQGIGQNSPAKTHKVMSSISEENKEVSQNVDEDEVSEKQQLEVVKRRPDSVLGKLMDSKEAADKKTDLMEELGLGDVDDLEDASDWDSASSTSKTVPVWKVEEEPVRSTSPVRVQPAVQEQEPDPPSPKRPSPSETPPVPGPRSVTPRSSLQPLLQPRTNKRPEGEEDSDWDTNNASTSSPTKTVKSLPNLVETEAVLKPDSPVCEPSLMEGAVESERCAEAEEQLNQEKDVLNAPELDVSKPYHLGPLESPTPAEEEMEEEDEDERPQDSEQVPWEKRYEKIWVESEKREVKSYYKNVAAELKEKFGELGQKERSDSALEGSEAEEVKEEEEEEEERKKEVEALVRTAEEESSEEEEEGETLVRPTARARSTVLLPIPEQRESGLEDSVSEEPTQPLEPPDSPRHLRSIEVSETGEPELPQDSPIKDQESQLPSPEPSRSYIQETDSDLHCFTKSCVEGSAEPNSDHDEDDSSTVSETKAEVVLSKASDLVPVAESNQEVAEEAEEKKPSICADYSEVPLSDPEVPPSPSASCPSAPSHVLDEELVEDMQRFKHEVGMLKVVFLDMQKEKARLQKEAAEDKEKAMKEERKPSALWDTGGPNRQSELDQEKGKKPETNPGNPKPQQEEQCGNLSHQREQGGVTQTLQLKNPNSADRTPAEEEDKEEEGKAIGSQATLLVPALEQGRPPPHTAHLNGDPLSVFGDSSLSEVSEDEGRSPSAGNRKNKNAGELEMADDFDDLTQSSDTATEDLDSPTSGYRHASLLIKQFDSSSIDSVSMVKLQNMFHEYERTIQRERDRHSRLADKMSQLEQERAELRLVLEEIRDGKSSLEHLKMDLETDLNNLKFVLKQEQEKHRNASMLYDRTREQLRRKEEQHRAEAEERQKVELAVRNLELEMRALVNNMKQLEEDRSETQRLLAQERSARALQEELLNSHLRKQQNIEDENRRNLSKSNEALSQLTEASDREKELHQQIRGLQEELVVLRAELERARAHSRQEEGRLSDESEVLRERLEDARRDLKLNEEALAQTVYQYNGQLTAVKAECSVASAKLEHERQARQQLEAEAESGRTRLQAALQEAERCQAARTDAERALHRERDERQRAQEKRAGEAGAHRDAVHSLSQKLAKAEARANGLENECHRTALALTEKGVLLETGVREREQAAARLRELEAALQAEREQAGRAGARQETAQERLAQAQSEAALLRQQLEEAQNKGSAKERAVTDAQERFSDILDKLRADSEDRVQLVEERSKELASKNAEQREQQYKMEQEKSDREASLRQRQQELADSLKKLSMCEASLEVNTRYRSDLEEEKTRTLKDMDRLKGKLQESEDRYVQAEQRISSLKGSLDDKEREVITASQKLQEALSASAATDKTIKQLEEAVQRLEIENARLEAAAKQQTNRIEVLQKGVQEAAVVRNRLEDLVTNLQSSKMTLEDQLNQEVQKQSMLSHNAQDSQALWEEELKSRSRLGLRLAELEKEKGELSNQVEVEKKKAKKVAEQKKCVDVRLDQEMKRNTELQKEMYRLRTLVKTAKKKLREQDGAELGSPLSSLRGEMGQRHTEAENAIGRMKNKVDELQLQLEKEASRCSRLETANGELKEQLASLKSLSRSHERLERSKRQLEEEVSGLRRQMDAGVMDQSQAEQYRRETDERARQEIRHKLEEVNLFLQTQAVSQEALEQIKAANETSQRAQLEQRIKELEGELGRTRSTQQDSQARRETSRTELEHHRQLYAEELRLRKSLAAKLDRSNERLAEANTKLLSERQRSKSLIASSIVNGSLGGPSLEVGSLGSVGAYGATLGPLSRSLGLGSPLLGTVGDPQSSRVEAYLAKMQTELEKNISKELDYATAELEGGSARVSPVGSACGSQKSLSLEQQDPVSRATQQYLEVFKKNYMI